MRLSGRVILATLIVAATWRAPANATSVICPPDAVPVGLLCVDKYEASVWRLASAETDLIAKIRAGTIASAAELPATARRGLNSYDYDPGCPQTAEHCKKFYAASIPGVRPSRFITWFQAAAACRNAGKRLLTHAEWQLAAYGTPDVLPAPPTGCNAGVPGLFVATGSRPDCVSDVGAYDMVGNLAEWVADWEEIESGCDSWMNSDASCSGGSGADGHAPSVAPHGGSFNNSAIYTGVFARFSHFSPASSAETLGFRCVR